MNDSDLSDVLNFKKESEGWTEFDNERWLIMIHPSDKNHYIIGKFRKNFYSFDYTVVGNTVKVVESLSEAKLKTAILGVELWMPDNRVWSSHISYNSVKYSRKII